MLCRHPSPPCTLIKTTTAGIVLLLFASIALASARAVVKDGWGREVTVTGYNDEKLDEQWYVHDPARPQPKAVEPDASPTLGAKPPEGAVVLFDGRNLDAWTGASWHVNEEEGYMEVRRGTLRSREAFGSCRLHIEWAAPAEVRGSGQGRGNSGVFMMGRYEVQVLDSWKNATYPDGMAAALYGQRPPDVNAAREPGQWQTFEITFIAPRFAEDGKVTRPARITVVWNGHVVHDNVELIGSTTHRRKARYQRHADRLPLTLQDHGNPVRFRNIWLVPIDEDVDQATPPQ